MRTHVDLFSGIGGFALAASWHGVRTIQFCEIDKRCRDFLGRAWPGVPCHDDIRTLTIDTHVSQCYNRLSRTEQEIIDMGARSTRYEAATELYAGGLSIQDVANFYGVTRQAMWMILKRRGCAFRDHLKYQQDNHFFRGGITASDRVHNITELAIEKGLLVRPSSCEICGEESRIVAHHDDYNRPLIVRWLCTKCHYVWHEHNTASELKILFSPMAHSEISARGGLSKEVTHEELLQRINDATRTFLLTGGVP